MRVEKGELKQQAKGGRAAPTRRHDFVTSALIMPHGAYFRGARWDKSTPPEGRTPSASPGMPIERR